MVNPPSHPLLDPAVLARIGDLSLAARMIVDGTMFGAHRSRMPGAGLEFSQFRSYQAGDDLRRVDWKLFARSDRYFVRESETETSVLVRLVVDASGSMGEPLRQAGGDRTATVLDYARLLAAALALVAVRQGDAVALVSLAGHRTVAIPPQHGPQQLRRVLGGLGALTAAGRWPAWNRIEPLLLGGAAGARRGITILLTDGREHGDEIGAAAARLAAVRHDLLVVQLVGPAEEAFPFEGPVACEDLETGKRIEVDAAAARPSYLEGLREEERAFRRAVERRGGMYVRIATRSPLDRALANLLRARERAGAGG